MTTLSNQQQLFFDKVTNLDFDKILLTGEGGTGKTYVLTAALEYLIDAGLRVLVCAPTHMARMTILDKFSPEIRHRVENKTVASALKRFGFKTNEGSTAFSKGTGDFLNQYDIIAIDEVSMLSQRDLNFFLNATAKIICTGAPRQLPVVKQKQADLKVFASTHDHIHLTEQLRQQGAILTLAQKCRDTLYVPQREDMNPDAGLLMLDDEDTLISQFVAGLEDSHDGEQYHVWNYRYLTHTNEECARVNAYTRLRLYPDASAPYIPGEHLILNETCEIGYNAEVIKIDNVESHDLPAWNATYYEVFANGSVIKTFDQPTWERISAEISYMRSQLNALREEKRFDQVKSYTQQIDYIENTFVKVAYPYACTVHKCQGQTIAHVYLNCASIDKATNKRALLYVGISRASETLHVVEVPLREWQAQRQCNYIYKEGRALYEAVFQEKYYRLRDKLKGVVSHGCKTLDEKYWWGVCFKANAAIVLAYVEILMVRYRR